MKKDARFSVHVSGSMTHRNSSKWLTLEKKKKKEGRKEGGKKGRKKGKKKERKKEKDTMVKF